VYYIYVLYWLYWWFFNSRKWMGRITFKYSLLFSVTLNFPDPCTILGQILMVCRPALFDTLVQHLDSSLGNILLLLAMPMETSSDSSKLNRLPVLYLALGSQFLRIHTMSSNHPKWKKRQKKTNYLFCPPVRWTLKNNAKYFFL